MQPVKIAFLLNTIGLSGGVGVIMKHAIALRREYGHDVTVVLTEGHGDDQWNYPELADLEIIDVEGAHGRKFDVAIATWWETSRLLGEVTATHRAYFVQSIEDRFYPPATIERMLAAQTYNLPLTYVTEAGWIRDVLTSLNPDNKCFYVRNGIDKAAFKLDGGAAKQQGAPLKIVVEGHPDIKNKGIAEACDALAQVSVEHEVTFIVPSAEFDFKYPDGANVVGPLDAAGMAAAFNACDLLLKLSRVEGMFGPPLEAFHCGATAIVAPVTGHDEYIEHAENAVIVDWDDPKGAARWIDLLGTDRELLATLKTNALETARQWPSWDESSAEFNTALQELMQLPEPDAGSAIRSNLRDSYAAAEAIRRRTALELDDARWGRMSPMSVYRLRRAIGQRLPDGLKRRLRALLFGDVEER